LEIDRVTVLRLGAWCSCFLYAKLSYRVFEDDRTQDIVNGQTPAPWIIGQLNEIFGQLADQIGGDRATGDIDPKGLSALVESFSKMITGEFYASTGNDQLVGPAKDNRARRYLKNPRSDPSDL
jgi:hypothetical protein